MSLQHSQLDSDRYRRLSVLFLAAVISVLFLMVIWDFLMALLLAGIFASLLHPVYQRILEWCGGRKAVASIITILLTMILIGVPLLILTGVVIGQAAHVSESALQWMEHHMTQAELEADKHALIQRFPFLDGVLPEKERLIEGAGKLASQLGGYLVHSMAVATAGAASFFLNTFVMLYSMFIFLIRGIGLLRSVLHYLPLPSSDKKAIMARFTEVSRATIKGSLVIGFIQGMLGGIGLHFAGIDGAAFWGAIMMVLSVIPGIGAPIVWLPAVIFLFVKGDTMAAILLFAWCAAVVSNIDNVLRPKLVGKDAKMPDILILVGTLGGIFLYGPVGFIIGPIICALFITIWEIYGVAFGDALETVEADEA